MGCIQNCESSLHQRCMFHVGRSPQLRAQQPRIGRRCCSTIPVLFARLQPNLVKLIKVFGRLGSQIFERMIAPSSHNTLTRLSKDYCFVCFQRPIFRWHHRQFLNAWFLHSGHPLNKAHLYKGSSFGGMLPTRRLAEKLISDIQYLLPGGEIRGVAYARGSKRESNRCSKNNAGGIHTHLDWYVTTLTKRKHFTSYKYNLINFSDPSIFYTFAVSEKVTVTQPKFHPFFVGVFRKAQAKGCWDTAGFSQPFGLGGNIMIQNEGTEGGSGGSHNLTDYRGTMKYYQSKQCIMIFR